MDKKILIGLSIILIIIVAIGIYFVVATKGPKSYNVQGMKVEILQQGSGAGAKVGDNVKVDYTGTLMDGTKFDSSIGRDPFEYTLGQNRVIQGWELGLVGMKVGEKRKLTIPPELGYGAAGAGNTIPPNSTIIFEIDMLGIN